MSVGIVLLVALGGAVGSATRYLVDRALQTTLGAAFPWGTFTVNLLAALGLGVMLGGPAPAALVAALGTGFCAGLSTWSTLGYETVRLAQERAPTAAVLNVVASAFAGLGAVTVGLALGAAVWT